MALSRLLLWADATHATGPVYCGNDRICYIAPPPSLFVVNGTDFIPVDADADLSLPVELHPKSRLLPNLLFAAAALLAASFFLLLATYAVHRLRRRRRRLSAASASIAPSSDDGGGGGDFDLFQDGEVDHHVWHIRTVGLDDAAIQSLGSRVYDPKDGLLADCAVCLAELRDGEVLRLLPKCAHAFHVSCVDTWLRSHVSCPLCRSPVLSPAEADSPIESEPIPIAPAEPESDHAPLELAIAIDIGSSSANSSSQMPIDLGDGNELQPIRRSVSLDSSTMAALLSRVNSEMKLSRERKEDQSFKNRGKKVTAALMKSPLQMKRSMSSRSGRFFLSRYARPRSSVLPL